MMRGAGGCRLAEICAGTGMRCLNMAGRTTLIELCSVLENARVVIGSDAGPMHIASALAVPTVVITGGGHPGRFFPYAVATPAGKPLPAAVSFTMPCFSCNWVCNFKVAASDPFPCIESVGVDGAEREVDAVLRGEWNRQNRLRRPQVILDGGREMHSGGVR